MTKEEFLLRLESAIRQYAKRQMTWFKKEKRIRWVGNDLTKTERLVKNFL
ncbi:MAG TPA: hypothetical protein VJJ02_02745 [Candidatus Paceibacterota bacterium]